MKSSLGLAMVAFLLLPVLIMAYPANGLERTIGLSGVTWFEFLVDFCSPFKEAACPTRIVGKLSYRQQLNFRYSSNTTVLQPGQTVLYTISLLDHSPPAPAIELNFTYQNRSYSFRQDLPNLRVPGFSVLAIAVPAQALSDSLRLPMSLKRMDIDINMTSRVVAGVGTRGGLFRTTESRLSWNSSENINLPATMLFSPLQEPRMDWIEILPSSVIKLSAMVSLAISGVEERMPLPTLTLEYPPQVTDTKCCLRLTWYSLIVRSGHSRTTGSGWYEEGAVANPLIATTVEESGDTRVIFTGWAGHYTSDSPSFSVTVKGPIEVVANWKTQHRVSLAAGKGGLTDPAPGSYWVDEREIFSMTAQPAFGYIFMEWLKDGTSHSYNSRVKLRVEKPLSLEARFDVITAMRGEFLLFGVWIALPLALFLFSKGKTPSTRKK